MSGSVGPLYVLDDPSLAACRLVSRVFGATLLPAGTRPAPSQRVLAVVGEATRGEALLAEIRHARWRPALVVSWCLAEDLCRQLLELRVPVLDGACLSDPVLHAVALDALAGRWSSGEFARQAEAAAELASIEALLGWAGDFGAGGVPMMGAGGR